jgi:hypothetical protein
LEIWKQKKIAILLNQVELVAANKSILFAATSNEFKDHEDALQFQCAITITAIDGIITRNKKDFKYSTIPVFTLEEVLY